MPGAKGREIIQIQVGKSGNAIGHEFWRDLCEEHKISQEASELMNGQYTGEEGAIQQEHLDVYFNEGNKGRYVPRAILADLNMQDLQSVVNTPLGKLYRPDNVIGNDEGRCVLSI